MRFQLLDRIDAFQPGKSLRGCKFLALGEEYLADHFPQFPVMPGVLMLQTLVEAATWLWRVTSGYKHTVIVLREVKNVKYGSFMQPGRRLDIVVEFTSETDDVATFKGKGTDDAGQQTVSASFVLHGYSLSDRGPAGIAADDRLRLHWKSCWALLSGQLKKTVE